MGTQDRFRDAFVARGENARVSLAGIDPDDTGGIKRKKAENESLVGEETMLEWQMRLWAEKKQSLLVVLQAMDTGGKDGTVKHAMGRLNPMGADVVGFGPPTPEEARHDFLWRIKKELPNPGEIVIFNRSHYEDVLVARVKGLVPPEVIEKRYDQINKFEKDLVDHGTTIVKFCLHISYEEQRERLLARLHDPNRRWKFSENDIKERAFWDDYWSAYDVALTRCNTPSAPWYVIPANHKWYRNWVVARILTEVLKDMNPKYPQVKLDIPALEKRLKQVPARPGQPRASRQK